MTIQLNPPIPMRVVKNPYGIPEIEGMAILTTITSQDHDREWTIWDYDTGEIWEVRNPYVRMSKNRTLGRATGAEKGYTAKVRK